MRGDAKRLLERLNQPDFAYHEFAGRFSDLELWPLFIEILGDPRLPGQPAAIARDDADDEHREPAQDARSILKQLADMAATGAL